jgi:hypothetical protein
LAPWVTLTAAVVALVWLLVLGSGSGAATPPTEETRAAGPEGV